MLRVYFLQQWYQLSDTGAEEALYTTSSRCALSLDWNLVVTRSPTPGWHLLSGERETNSTGRHRYFFGFGSGKPSLQASVAVECTPRRIRARKP
jgi:hypothetical protein